MKNLDGSELTYDQLRSIAKDAGMDPDTLVSGESPSKAYWLLMGETRQRQYEMFNRGELKLDTRTKYQEG